jgi:hypothetical protein
MKEIKFLPIKKTLGTDGFTIEFNQAIMGKIISNL